MDGLVAILNQELEAKGDQRRYTPVSRTVKRVYDRVHAEYDGTWDEETKAYVDPRTTFFEPREILAMAEEVEGEPQDERSL